MDAIKKEKVVEMYNEGYSATIIAKAVGESRDSVNSWLKGQKKKGLIQARKSTICVEGYHTKDTSYDDVIAKMYNENAKLKEIASEIGKSESFVDTRISDLRDRGLLIKRKRVSGVKVKKEPRVKTKRVLNRSFEKHDPIEVTPTMCKSCIYGRAYDSKEKGLCRFMDCTGVARITLMPIEEIGCPSIKNRKIKCNVYSKVTPDNPRRKSITDDTNICGMGTH